MGGEHSVLPVAPKPLSPRLRMPPPPRRSCRKVAAPAPAQATALQTSFEPIRKVAAPAPAPAMAEAKPAEEKKYVATDAVISAACNPSTEIMSESASVHEAFDYVERATAEMLAESVVSSAAEAKPATDKKEAATGQMKNKIKRYWAIIAESVVSSAAEAKPAKDKKEAATDAVTSGAGSHSELASEAASGSSGQAADYVARSTAQIIAESVVSTTPKTTGTAYSVGTFDDVAVRVGSRTGSDASDTSGKVKYTVVKGV